MPRKAKGNSKNSGGVGTEAIKVFVRVRPPISNEATLENAITVPSSASIKLSSERHNLTCSYDHVFSELADQNDVFQEIQPLLSNVLAGYNGCIFAYGQTSAGKTHTMLGPNGGTNLNVPKEQWGILPRSAEFLFQQLEDSSAQGNFRYTAKASFLQIYKEKLFDLLRGSGSFEDGGESDLKIREVPRLHDPVTGEAYKKDENRPAEVFISGLSEYRVQTASDVLKILSVGTSNRHTRSTDYNDTSSRSHALLQLSFEVENKQTDGQVLLYRSKLSLVDLAGSEKMQAVYGVSNDAHHLKELTSINKSLSSLGNVIASLTRKKRSHVPYRDSKLTRILQDSLGGNTRTVLITCVAPTVLHANESASTLQFADRARNVMLKAKANMVVDDKVLLADAQTEIARLKLLLKQALKKLEDMGDARNNSVGEFIDDGETNEELERVLKQNKKLRRENKELNRVIVNMRLQGCTGASHDVYLRNADGNSKAKRGKKPEWKSSLVDDDEYRKPKAKPRRRGGDSAVNHQDIRTSRSSPMPLSKNMPEGSHTLSVESLQQSPQSDRDSNVLPKVETKGSISSSSKHSNNNKKPPRGGHVSDLRSAVMAQVGQAENAIQNSFSSSIKDRDGKVSGSPSSKSTLSTKNRHSDIGKEDIPTTSNNNDQEDDDDDDDDALDVKKFRENLDRARTNKQLKAVEQRLNSASRKVVDELEKDTSALNKIQASRAELERQLKELEMASADESSSPVKSETRDQADYAKATPMSTKSNKAKRCTVPPEKSPSAQSSTPDMSHLSSVLDTVTRGSTATKESTEKSHNDGNINDKEGKSPASKTRPRTKSEVKDQHPPADLKYSTADIGRTIELYSYKYAKWDKIELIDFNETNGNRHKCKNAVDKSEKWLDLKTKPIRGLPECSGV